MIRSLGQLAILIAAFSSASQLAHATIVIQDFNANKHDRFVNSPEFIGNSFNWASVGRSTSGNWGTLISPSYIVSIAHGITSGTMRFYQSNNPNGSFVERNIVSGGQIAGTDLYLSRLNAPATGITPMAIANFANSSDAIGQTIFVAGLSAGAPNFFVDQRFGRNTIDQVLPNFMDMALGATKGDVILFDYDNPGGVGADEAWVQGGDSGAPSVVVSNGQLALVGVHWFQYTEGDFAGAQRGSGDTLASSYIAQLNAAMLGESVTLVGVQAVPEPSSMLALLTVLSGSAMAARQRRQRRTINSSTV